MSGRAGLSKDAKINRLANCPITVARRGNARIVPLLPVVIVRSVRLLTRAVQCWPRVAPNRDHQGADAATSATS